jgi:hypothetical protein
MKLIAVFSASHETLKDEWFLRTLKDDYDVRLRRCDVRGPGSYMQEDWTQTIVFKCDTIIDAIQKYWDERFVYSDVDVAFFGPTERAILDSLAGRDIVCQLDDPAGTLCTGFFALHANDRTLRLWQEVRRTLERERRRGPVDRHTVLGVADGLELEQELAEKPAGVLAGPGLDLDDGEAVDRVDEGDTCRTPLEGGRAQRTRLGPAPEQEQRIGGVAP